MGLTNIGDPGIFTNQKVTIATHVGDMAGFAEKKEDLITIEQAIEHHVELEKLGTLAKLLGMEITCGLLNKHVMLTQRTAIEGLAKKHGITIRLLIATKSLPFNPINYIPNKVNLLQEQEKKRYQSLVGSLLYMPTYMTRDITLYQPTWTMYIQCKHHKLGDGTVHFAVLNINKGRRTKVRSDKGI